MNPAKNSIVTAHFPLSLLAELERGFEIARHASKAQEHLGTLVACRQLSQQCSQDLAHPGDRAGPEVRVGSLELAAP